MRAAICGNCIAMRQPPSMKISRKPSPDGPAELHAIDAAAAHGRRYHGPRHGGQNATSPYGMAFQTGNMMMPQQAQQQAPPMQGMLGQGPSSVLQQPMAAYR